MKYAVVLLVLLTACAAPPSSHLRIATSFFPLYDLTKAIVGNQAEAYSLVPAGTEPHEYEPSPSDSRHVAESAAFVTMGVEFAPFEDKLANAAERVKIIRAGTDVPLITSGDVTDPHIWLSPKNAKIMAQNIAQGIIALDSVNAAEYEQNAQELQKQLDSLDADFTAGLAGCQKHTVLVSHNAFSYLGRDYGFETIHISGLEPETEPTPMQIKDIVDTAKRNDLHYVFYEELVDPRVAQTIAEEVGAKTLELSPLEGSGNPQDTYVSLMRQNLKNLRIALECA